MRRREFAFGSVAAAAARPKAYDTEGQEERRRLVFDAYRKAVTSRLAGGTVSLSPRGVLALLSAESTRSLGNESLRRFLDSKPVRDHFVDVGIAQILTRHHDQLEPRIKDGLTDLLYSALKEDGAKRIFFMGFNDNYPAMDTAYAVLGGRFLDHALARRRGAEALVRVREMLQRRGMLSEYTSNTYSPISLLCYADVAEFAETKADRSLAAAIENRIWLDLAAHWHPPTNVLAGPHSRAYLVDCVGHFHSGQMALFHVFGDRVWMTPREYLFPPAPHQLIHLSVPSLQGLNVWIAASTYHPRPEIAKLLFEKSYPYRMTATAEYGAAPSPALVKGPDPEKLPTRTGEVFEYPSGELVATTYMTEDYAVGSTTAQFHQGYQTNAFFVNFRRTVPARSIMNTGTIFCRYTTDEGSPGRIWTDPEHPERGAGTYTFADEGRARTAQKDACVMVAYQAKGQIHGIFRALRLTIVIPVLGRPIRRVLAGDDEVRRLPFESTEPRTVWLEDELLLAAFRPMEITNHGRPCALRIAEQNGYFTISFCNYEGPPREFNRIELYRTVNGFVAEVGSRREESFDAFRSRVAAARLSDEILGGQRVADYRRAGLQLGLSHSFLFNGLKYVLIDHRPQLRPQFQATGMDAVLLEI